MPPSILRVKSVQSVAIQSRRLGLFELILSISCVPNAANGSFLV
jgi:hypothetical protein